jgi:LPXTG-site transpeptidase (sortase) family protein
MKNVRLPLFPRVVALYVLAAVPIWALVSLQPAPQVASVSAVKPEPVITVRSSDLRAGQPASISVPRLGINLPIIDGEYDAEKDSWTLSKTKAHFATMTSLPNNETGNTFIYGHNTNEVFAPLAWLEEGDIVRVRTTNKLVFQYRFSGKKIVDPNATSILANARTPRLTLMTCEGVFSQARSVMYFDYERIL